MSINIGPPSVEELRPRITVIGVGGAGGNAIANMIDSELEGVDFIVTNTDAQALNIAKAEQRIQLGPDITQGLGAGSRPEVGRAAAEETVAEIEKALEGVNMVFIAAGMGGGTGTGAAPVIAEVARSKGILTVGVVTKPFLFEGTRRMRSAETGIEELQKHVDTLIVIPNQNLFLIAKADTTFREAFQLADEVLQQGVRSITDLMVMPGLINLDFADVRSVMNEMGKAMMGTGEGEGDNRALEAAERAIANPLLEGVSMQGAKGVIISIIGGEDMKLLEVDEAANHIRELVDPEANIIWGSAFNPDLEGKIRVSVVATGIEASSSGDAPERQPLNLSSARGPKKPVLPLPSKEELEESAQDSAVLDTGGLEAVGLDLGVDSADGNDVSAEADADTSGDDISLSAPSFNDDEDASESSSSGFASLATTAIERNADADEDSDDGDIAFDLTQEAGVDELTASDGQDELLLNAERLAERDEPVQSGLTADSRRGLLGGAATEPNAGDAVAQKSGKSKSSGVDGSGSTLFERMANLSRGSGSTDEEDEDEGDGASSMRIPRFLGRQNNQ